MTTTIIVFTLLIPSVKLVEAVYEAPVKEFTVELDGVQTPARQAEVPGKRIGWVPYSGLPGQGENIIVIGHNPGKFANLPDLEVGKYVLIARHREVYWYKVTEREVIPFDEESIEEKVRVSGDAHPGPPERLTLVTCLGDARLIYRADPIRFD